MNSYGENPKFQFLRTSSINSISQSSQNARDENKKSLSKAGEKKPVLEELYRKGINHEVKQEAVVLADELAAASKYKSSDKAVHKHDWLDDNGNNDWEKRIVYIQEKNKTVWEATLHVATTKDGRRILYDINPINMTEGARKQAPAAVNNNVTQTINTVKGQNSLSKAGETSKKYGKNVNFYLLSGRMDV